MPETLEAPAAVAAEAPKQTARESAFADLEALGGETPEQSNEQETKQTSEAAKPSDTKPQPETKKETADPTKPDAGKQAEKKKGSIDEFRSSYEKVKQERDEFRTKYEELTKAKPPEDPEKPKLRETLAEREKRLEELEGTLRFVNYEKSTEYQDKYQKPMESAMAAAQREIAELIVTDADGNERAGTTSDFNELLRAPTTLAATKLAREKFGDAYPEAMAHRRKLMEMNSERTAALDKFRKEGGEREKKEAEQRSAQDKIIAESFDGTRTKLRTEHPKWYAPVEGDTEGNALLEQGQQFATAAFSKTPDRPPAEFAALQAEVAERAANFGRVAMLNAKLSKEIERLSGELTKLKASDPGAGDGRGEVNGSKTPSLDDTMEAAIRGK